MIEVTLEQAFEALRELEQMKEPDPSKREVHGMYVMSDGDDFVVIRNVEQARALVDMFGGDNEVTVTVLELGEEAHSGTGLYAYHTDYPDEGSACLDLPKD
jgi:hypothetical protein